MQQRRQFSLLSLLTAVTVSACLFSLWASESLPAKASSLGALYVLALLIAIKQRRSIALAALCAGPMLGAAIGGAAAVFDPMYVLPEDRILVASGCTILGLFVGTLAGWVVLCAYWVHDSR